MFGNKHSAFFMVVSAALLGGLACGDAGLPDIDFAKQCDGRELETCDVRELSCQHMYVQYVACLREVETPLVPQIQTMSIDAFETRLRQEYALEDEGHINRVGYGLSLIDLVAPGVDVVEAKIQRSLVRAIAVYFTSSRDIAIIEHGNPFNDINAGKVLSHELVHAMQDRETNLDNLYDTYGTDDDRDVAVSAIVEGEARLYEDMVGLALQHDSMWNVDWDSTYASRISAGVFRMDAEESPWVEAQGSFSYSFGGKYLTDAWFDGQTSAVREIF